MLQDCDVLISGSSVLAVMSEFGYRLADSGLALLLQCNIALACGILQACGVITWQPGVNYELRIQEATPEAGREQLESTYCLVGGCRLV